MKISWGVFCNWFNVERVALTVFFKSRVSKIVVQSVTSKYIFIAFISKQM